MDRLASWLIRAMRIATHQDRYRGLRPFRLSLDEFRHLFEVRIDRKRLAKGIERALLVAKILHDHAKPGQCAEMPGLAEPAPAGYPAANARSHSANSTRSRACSTPRCNRDEASQAHRAISAPHRSVGHPSRLWRAPSEVPLYRSASAAREPISGLRRAWHWLHPVPP